MTRLLDSTIGEVLDAVASRTGVPVEDLKGRSRRARIAYARQLAYFVLRDELELPLARIGAALGRKHGAVHDGIKAIDKLRRHDLDVAGDIEEIRAGLRWETGATMEGTDG